MLSLPTQTNTKTKPYSKPYPYPYPNQRILVTQTSNVCMNHS